MKNYLFTLATMLLVMLLVVSMSEAQVATFRIVDPAGEGTVHLPGTTFDINFLADTSTIPLPTPPDFLRSVQFVVQITFPFGGDMAPTNVLDPFTTNPDLPIEGTDPNSYDDVTKTLRFSYRAATGSGVSVGEDNILITTVNFTSQGTPGPARLIHQNVGLSTGTHYRLADSFTTIGVPVVDTPAIDIPLPIELSAFTAVPADKGVMIKWRTESELNNLGFDVYRSESLDGTFAKVNQTRIQGTGTDANPHNYKFFDEGVEVGKTYYYYLEDISYSGVKGRSDIIKVTVDPTGKLKVVGLVPSKFALLQNYPNPFNPETWIPFQLARDTSVAVRIYNLKGQPIRTLELGQKAAGTYLAKDKAVYWDGRDNVGEKVASGMYFYTLKAGEFMSTRRMVIIQ